MLCFYFFYMSNDKFMRLNFMVFDKVKSGIFSCVIFDTDRVSNPLKVKIFIFLMFFLKLGKIFIQT